MELIRTAKVQITKVGGNAGKNALKCRVQIPTLWAKSMGLNVNERDVDLMYNDVDKEVRIRKRKG